MTGPNSKVRVIVGIIMLETLPVVALTYDSLRAVAVAASPALIQMVFGLTAIGVLAGVSVFARNVFCRSAG